MHARTVFGRFSICLAAMLLVAFMTTPAFADEVLPTLNVSDEMTEAALPTIAEFEHYGPKTPDTSRDAISHMNTHIATPEQALRAEEATTTASIDLGADAAMNDAAMHTSLVQNGDSVAEGLVVVLGAVVIVAFSLLIYHFRKE